MMWTDPVVADTDIAVILYHSLQVKFVLNTSP